MASIAQTKNQVKQFSTVMAMATMTTTRRESVRPKFILCSECGGTKVLEYDHPETGERCEMECGYCRGRGAYIVNADHLEHRSRLMRIAAAGINAIKAVLL